MLAHFVKNADSYDLQKCLQVKDVFDMEDMLAKDLENVDGFLGNGSDEDRLGLHNLISLLIENQSIGLQYLLNQFSYMITKEDIQHGIQVLAAISSAGDLWKLKTHMLEIILNSEAFKKVYFESVTTTGYECYTNSF